jgi:class 3 adenylate cyclase/tetratricopeptide (TPR) repeat protein
MKCPRCHHENLGDATFCDECGTRLEVVCPTCQEANRAGAKFCRKCGHGFDAARAVSSPQSPPPISYTPKYLAERILTSKAAIEGERKYVTVLFADLKGSMELLADRDPEEARRILDPVIELMMDAIHRYEGTVNQVMGDGIMALFGAPIAHEDHAVRACYAALRMQESAGRYADGFRRSHGVEIHLRIGINSGDVVVRSVGSDLRMDYTAVGQTTHLAARMEQLATPGTIRLTADTLRLAEGFIDVKPLGPIPVKGLAQPIEVYEATGAGTARTRLQASARRGLTRFVGRDPEMDLLRRAHELAGRGSGQIAAIVGEPGVGKSRLVYEFTHSHRLHGWLVLESASVSYGRATSYLPVVDLLKSYFKLQDRADRREIVEKVTGKLLTLDRALEPALPPLLELLDVPAESQTWRALEPAERRQRTLDAVRHLLLREAREQPLLLIFEDLHWIDTETQVLLDALVESLGSSRVMLLVNYRPEYQHGWGSRTYYSQMRLDALPAESAGELLDALLGEDAALRPLKQLLVKRGNPFFLEESVRTLIETGALLGERGRYRLTQPVHAIQVPATVQAILAARIDRLAPEDKRLLQVASVVGKDVPFVLLQAVAELTDEQLRRGLDRLQAAEFLYESGLFPDLEYTFKHALTHEVTYGGLLQERRRGLHAKLVGAIEGLHRDRLAAQIDRLAHHAFRGEMWDKALSYLTQVGDTAAARSANREAATYFEQALTALTHLPESPQTLAHGVDLNSKHRNALYAYGELEKQLLAGQEAERLARKLGEPRRLALTLARLSSALMNAGRPAVDAIRAAESAVPIAAGVGDVLLHADILTYAGQARVYAGDLADGEAAFREVLGLEPAARDAPGTAGDVSYSVAYWAFEYSRCLLVWSLAPQGRFEEASVFGREALTLAESQEHGHGIVRACWALGYLYAVKGDVALAIQWWERGLALSREIDRTVPAVLMAGSLCYVYALAGRTAESLAGLDDAIKGHESLPAGGIVHALIGVHVAEACRLTGRRSDALAQATRALMLTRARGQRAYEVSALRLLAELEASEERWREAFALATELALRPLIADCHLGLAKLYRDAGARDQCHVHATSATTMYRELGMTFWLDRAQTELATL